MAGGQGTRFWPYSTLEEPKQFINIVGEGSLILQTFKRLEQVVDRDKIYVVAHGRYRNRVKEAIPNFVESNFIEEPFAKNTAPCLILSNIILSENEADGNLLVVPADHYIQDSDIFARQMRDAFQLAEEKTIVTFGITPDSPHTGYGYINFNREKPVQIDQTTFFEAAGFKEKPNRNTAQEYLDKGTYLWNSGMFVYKLRHFRDFLEQYSPYYYEQYQKLEESQNDRNRFIENFSAMEPESIDYALMEKVREVRISPVAFDWNDVGSWSSVYELNPLDQKGNACIGEHALIDTSHSMAFSTEKKPIAIIGLSDVIVVNTEHGILVSHKDHLQDVKKVHQQLKDRSK